MVRSTTPWRERWPIIIGGALLTLVIAVGGGWFKTYEFGKQREIEHQKLAAGGSLKAQWIQAWRQRLLVDAARTARSSGVVDYLAAGDTGSGDAARERVGRQLELDRDEGSYSEVLVLDLDERPALSTSDSPGALTDATRRALATARASRAAVLSDLYRLDSGQVFIDSVAPVIDASGDVVAAVVLRQDAALELFPALRQEPAGSETYETVLVEQDGDQVVFLSRSRVDASVALSQRLPLTREDLPAVRAIRGERGVFEGVDYRGSAVLSDLRPVEGTPWFLVTKVDQGEVYAVARFQSDLIVALLAALILAAFAGLGFLHRSRRARVLRRMLEAVRLQRVAEEHLRTALYSIGDAVIATDAHGAVQVMNPVAEELTGWTEAEAKGRSLDEVFRIVNETSRAPVESPVAHVLRDGVVVGLANHTVLLGRDGSERPIADSAAPVREGEGPIQGVVLVFRDQTEEQRTEQELRRLNSILGAIRNVNQLIVRERDAQQLIQQTCDELARTSDSGRAWVLLVDDQACVTAAAAAGFAEGTQSPRSLCTSGQTPRCLAAMSEDRPLSGHALEQVCSSCPLSEVHHGQAKVVARLERGGVTRGVLGFSRPGAESVMLADWELLAELADDLSFALGNIEEEERRRQAEDAVRRAADEYRSLTDHVPALVSRFDARLRHLYVNPALARTTGLSAEQLINRSVTETGAAQPTAAAWEARLRSVFDTGQTIEFEGSIPLGGARRTFHTTLVPERTDDGSVSTVLSLSRDITERKRSDGLEAARMRLLKYAATHSVPEFLRRVLDEAEALSDSLVGFCHFVDADQVTLSLQAWSTRTVEVFCRAEGQGQHYRLEQAGVWADAMRERRPIVHNDYASLPGKRGLPEGHARVVRELVVPILRDEKVVALLGVGNSPADYTEDDVAAVTYLADVAWEITQRKLAEADREALLASLAQSDRLASMGMLAAGVAHEINNPLSYVLFNLETLAEDVPRLAALSRRAHVALAARVGEAGVGEALGDDQAFFDPATYEDVLTRLREAFSGTKRIKKIARSLGTFARVERVEATAVDVQSCLGHAITMAFNELKYRARLVKDYSSVPAVLASDGKLAQVFLNLLINAAHAIEEGHVEQNEVRIRTRAEGDWVIVEIADTGKGIPPEHQDKVFEPFFTTKGVGVGSGLGLSICRGIVEELGGDISLTSEVGRGTTFRVRLPRLRGAPEPVRGAAPARSVPRPEDRGRILVVDDEEGIRVSITRLLKTEHDVVAVPSGAEAQALLETDRRFDVIFCDLMMPEMSGMELHAWLVDQDPRLARQVVFVTGGAFTPGATEYLAGTGNLTVEKPFDTAGFRRTASELVLAARSSVGSPS